MREIVKFQAEDGTLFDTPEKCLHYERNHEAVILLSQWCEFNREISASVIHCIEKNTDVFVHIFNKVKKVGE